MLRGTTSTSRHHQQKSASTSFNSNHLPKLNIDNSSPASVASFNTCCASQSALLPIICHNTAEYSNDTNRQALLFSEAQINLPKFDVHAFRRGIDENPTTSLCATDSATALAGASLRIRKWRCSVYLRRKSGPAVAVTQSLDSPDSSSTARALLKMGRIAETMAWSYVSLSYAQKHYSFRSFRKKEDDYLEEFLRKPLALSSFSLPTINLETAFNKSLWTVEDEKTSGMF